MSIKYRPSSLFSPAQAAESEHVIYSKLKQEFVKKDGSLAYASLLLRRAACLYGRDTALIDRNRSISYNELYMRSVVFSQILIDSGVKPGDRVVLTAENSLSFYVAYFGIWQAGAVVVPLNTFLHEKELAHVIKDAQPAAIFASASRATVIKRLREQGEIGDMHHLFTPADLDLTTPYQDLAQAHNGFKPITQGSKDLCLLLYTSGTTGLPKGVMLSSDNVMTNALQSYARLSATLTPRERALCVLPLFHVFAQNACIWLPVISGGSVIIVSHIDRSLIREGLEHKPTLFLGVPALYGLLCLMKDAPLESVKMFVSGADALPDKIRAAFSLIYGRRICAGYGLTEASPVVAVNNDNGEQPTYSVGKPVCDLECQVRDESGSPVALGQIGTLWVRGGNVMMGYYKSPEATQEVLQDGWLNTGDLASFDEHGNLSIRGRSKDLIIHKGFNIYPQEIENTLMKHPEISKVAVVGYDDESTGQIPIAYVAIKQGNQASEQELRRFCSTFLAAYKVPRKFVCLEDLPMNATGKVDKKQLRLPE